jgi:hypothetical protein
MCRIQSTSTKTPLGQCVPRQDKPGLPAKRLLGGVGLEKRARGRLSHVHARISASSLCPCLARLGDSNARSERGRSCPAYALTYTVFYRLYASHC